MYCSSFFFPLHVQKSGILLDTSKTEPTNTEEIQAMQKTIKKSLAISFWPSWCKFHARGEILPEK